MIASIDIGTSYSSVCVLGKDGKAHSVKVATDISLFGGDYTLPTAVFLEKNGTMLVGQAAMNKSRKSPENFSWQFKRMLGQDRPVILGGQEYSVEKLYTELIFHMKNCAERSFGEEIETVFLTYPAAYGTRKKEKLVRAANGAGIFSVELIDEPTAAALNCCEEGEIQEGQAVLIYDFGGGTFDVSLLCRKGESFELLAEPMGLEDCGGRNIDNFIARDMMETVGSRAALLDRKRLEHQLMELAVRGKHHLSVSESFEEDINVGLEDIPYYLPRKRLNEGIATWVGQTTELCASLLSRAGMKKEELSAIWMVGGTSHVPLVQDMVKRFAGDVKVRQARDMELAVVKGALALGKAGTLKGQKEAKKEPIAEPIKEGTEKIDPIEEVISGLDPSVFEMKFQSDTNFRRSADGKSMMVSFEGGLRPFPQRRSEWSEILDKLGVLTNDELEEIKMGEPYMEIRYSNLYRKNEQTGMKIIAWGMYILQRGIWVREFFFENEDIVSHRDQYLTWRKFLFSKKRHLPKRVLLGEEVDLEIDEKDHLVAVHMPIFLNQLRNMLSQEVGKRYTAKITITSPQKVNFYYQGKMLLLRSGSTSISVGPGICNLMWEEPRLFITHKNAKEITVCLDIDDHLTLDLENGHMRLNGLPYNAISKTRL